MAAVFFYCLHVFLPCEVSLVRLPLLPEFHRLPPPSVLLTLTLPRPLAAVKGGFGSFSVCYFMTFHTYYDTGCSNDKSNNHSIHPIYLASRWYSL